MREVVITRTGGYDALEVQERPDDEPQMGQVRIRVKAAGVNFADTLARRGLYPDSPKLPTVVGYEIAGVVDRVGFGVSETGDAWLGREVVAFTRFKGYADTVCVPVEFVFTKPAALSFVEAASLPVTYATAWMLIHHSGGLRRGQSILIQNAGGGVGLAAIDIARHIGAGLIIGTASNRNDKHTFLRARGLTHPIDYTHDDVSARVKDITGGRGVDLIIDPIGGRGAWTSNYAMLRAGGRLGVFGASSLTELAERNVVRRMFGLLWFAVTMPWWNPLSLMNVNKGVFGVNLGHMWGETDRLREWMSEILQGYTDGWVRPHVSAVFPLEKAGEAHRMLEERRNVGKVVLVPSAEDAEAWTKANVKSVA